MRAVLHRTAWVTAGLVFGAAAIVGTAEASRGGGLDTLDCDVPALDPAVTQRAWPVFACGDRPRIVVAQVENGMQARMTGPFEYRRDLGCLVLRGMGVAWPPGTRPVRDGERHGVDVPGLGVLWEGQQWAAGGGSSPLDRVEGLPSDDPCLSVDGTEAMSLIAVDQP